MTEFELVSTFAPSGSQPEAIRELTEGLEMGERLQTLLGVTGSGKTYTMANVIASAPGGSMPPAHATIAEHAGGYVPRTISW